MDLFELRLFTIAILLAIGLNLLWMDCKFVQVQHELAILKTIIVVQGANPRHSGKDAEK